VKLNTTGNSPATMHTNVRLLLFVSQSLLLLFLPYDFFALSSSRCIFFRVPAHPFPSLWIPDRLRLFVFSIFCHSFPVSFQFLWMTEKMKAAASQPQLLQHTPAAPEQWDAAPASASPESWCSAEGCWLGMAPCQLWMLLVAAVGARKARPGTDTV